MNSVQTTPGRGIGIIKHSCRLFASTFTFIFLCLFLTACDSSVDEAYKKGEELWEAGKYKEALVLYEKLVAEHPKSHFSTDALYQIGNINYLNIRDYRAAIAAYRKLVELSPESPFSPDAQIKIADINKDKFGDLKGAIAEYERFVKVFPKAADKALYQMGLCYMLLKEFTPARVQYERILKEHPDVDYKDEICYHLANSYYLEGKTGEARKRFEDLLEKFPKSRFATDARFQVALTYEEEENLQEALLRLQQLRGVYHDDRVLDLRIKGVEERMAARKKPLPPKVAKRSKKK